MSDNRNERRRQNGSRLEGNALAMRVAKEVNGMMLAQAFVTAKSAGFKLRVNKSDGLPRLGYADEPGTKVFVDVVSGFVTKAWAS